MKKHKNEIIAGVIILLVLIATFFIGGGGEGAKIDSSENPELGIQNSELVQAAPIADNKATETRDVTEKDDPQQSQGTGKNSEFGIRNSELLESGSGAADVNDEAAKPDDIYEQDKQDKQDDRDDRDEQDKLYEPEESGESGESRESGEMTVTLIVSVATILDNMNKLADGKAELVPPDGVIFDGSVVFYEGESVFNVLQRETKRNRIHMEFVNTPIYNSAYIEGINNIYEFDVGERSGWMYSVNGFFPNYGSSRCILHDGDVIKWLYTCDRGADIGGGNAVDYYGFGE